MYLLLFRVEASDATNSASNIGSQTIATGAVAGFQMPTLRYYVGNSSNTNIRQVTKSDVDADRLVFPIILRWKDVADARLYRLEIEDEENKKVFSAVVLPSTKQYQLPSFVRELSSAKQLKWRVIAIDAAGKTVNESKFTQVK